MKEILLIVFAFIGACPASLANFHKLAGNSFRQISEIKTDLTKSNAMLYKAFLHTELLLYDVILEKTDAEGVQEVIGDLFNIVHYLLHDTSTLLNIRNDLDSDTGEDDFDFDSKEDVYECIKRGECDFFEWVTQEIVQLYVPLLKLFFAQDAYAKSLLKRGRVNHAQYEQLRDAYDVFDQCLDIFIERAGIKNIGYVKGEVYARIVPEWLFILVHKVSTKNELMEIEIIDRYRKRLKEVHQQFPPDTWERTVCDILLMSIRKDY